VGWTDGNAPPDVSVGGDHVPVLKTSQVCTSDALEAARQRVAQQRRDDAERIRIFQVKKLIISEAGLLRQRAADLEREAEEEEAGLTSEKEIFISAGQLLIRCRQLWRWRTTDMTRKLSQIQTMPELRCAQKRGSELDASDAPVSHLRHQVPRQPHGLETKWLNDELEQ
jgi:hypothetical protein